MVADESPLFVFKLRAGDVVMSTFRHNAAGINPHSDLVIGSKWGQSELESPQIIPCKENLMTDSDLSFAINAIAGQIQVGIIVQ